MTRLNGSTVVFTTLAGMIKPDAVSNGWPGIIHLGGWTTIAEFTLVEASIDSLNMQIEAAVEHYKRVIEAALRVGKSE